MQPLRSPYNPVHIPLGLVLWSIWFVVIYGGLSVGCSLLPPPPAQGQWTWLNASLGMLSVLTVVALLGLARLFQRAARRDSATQSERFVARLAAGVNLIGAIATVFVALPTLSLPPCL
ncbi:hypothetical protein [Ectopseudomonas mendocina]|uniref:Uncharacterized protein n=1 Tax=Ectopseudomonas mendocina S5.2 TaxID=1225174 RepID=A0ABN4IWR1_ECTME|nr:hypothetical protein [Pseudomonas mendocina]ALN19294.1 hypothetical protein DW68_011860 [Pseudomonas mendocina S5.2]KER99830.1 hypothetical protein HN51_08285 [Pseudomonas mendocina]